LLYKRFRIFDNINPVGSSKIVPSFPVLNLALF